MKIIKSISGRSVDLGGEVPSGWLPPGAATPSPTPRRLALLDVRILEEGNGGFILEWQSRNTSDTGDRWYSSVEEALREADELFGILPTDWAENDGAA
jgi:hypothetical protein